MPHVVITGSTRGIGRALARAFLDRDCAVTVNGTTPEGVERALTELQRDFPQAVLFGAAADLSRREEADRLRDEAEAALGPVDIWINNAGIPQDYGRAVGLKPERYRRLVDVNVLGTWNGALSALEVMSGRGRGRIFNMEGFGSDGMMRPGLTLYGTTKSAVRYFTRSLAREAAPDGVIVAALSPGMVLTDFVLNPMKGHPEAYRRAKKVFDILADTPETVAPFLAAKSLGPVRSGGCIAWLTRGKILRRFLASPFRRREVFPPLPES